MKMKLYIAKLLQAKIGDEYMEERVLMSDGIIEVIKIMGGSNWELIKPKEAAYQDFLEWFNSIEIK